jgi:hypothetical protein
MRIFAASALLALTLSAPAFAREHWAIVRDFSHRVVVGPFHDRAVCERVLHRDFRDRHDRCAIV